MPAFASSRTSRPHKSASFHHALRSWEDARYADVIAELGTEGDGESRILLAKTYNRTQDYRAAVACLNKAKFETPRLQSIAEILSASAAERLDRAARFAPKLAPNAGEHIVALRDFYAALSAWRGNDFDRSEDLATRAAAGGDLETRILATDLLAWVAHSKGHLDESCRYFLSVIDQLNTGEIRDEHVRINAVQALAFISAKSLDFGKLGRIERELESPSISPATSRAYLGALLSTAVLHSVAGEDEEHFRTLLAAKAVDVPKPFGALADTRLATFHRHHGEMESARMHMSFASEALEGVQWTNSDVEERLAAVVFAAEAAAQRDRRAGPAFTRAVSFRGKQDLALGFEHDRHSIGVGYFARARLSEMREKIDSSIEDYRRATEIFDEQGDRYRSSLASLEILRLEGGTRVSKSLRDRLRSLPSDSWLCREAVRLTETAASPLARLSPAERRVFEKICEGLTSRQIAEELDRSASTVRNQTISIFRKFGVSTRSALVAQARAST